MVEHTYDKDSLGYTYHRYILWISRNKNNFGNKYILIQITISHVINRVNNLRTTKNWDDQSLETQRMNKNRGTINNINHVKLSPPSLTNLKVGNDFNISFEWFWGLHTIICNE
jgi:hypothetical protein